MRSPSQVPVEVEAFMQISYRLFGETIKTFMSNFIRSAINYCNLFYFTIWALLWYFHWWCPSYVCEPHMRCIWLFSLTGCDTHKDCRCGYHLAFVSCNHMSDLGRTWSWTHGLRAAIHLEVGCNGHQERTRDLCGVPESGPGMGPVWRTMSWTKWYILN